MRSAQADIRYEPIADIEGLREHFQTNAGVRGKTILISVNSPVCVSTSIEPACCFTMTSWLIESPRPVPSPVGLVVKNGLNIFSFTSGVIPVPQRRSEVEMGLEAELGSAPL